KSTTWRNREDLFQSPPVVVHAPRVITLSPAWYAVGHSSEHFPLSASSSFRDRTGDQAFIWFSHHIELLAVLSGVLRIVHPEQYHLGDMALDRILGRTERITDIDLVHTLIKEWGIPFTCLSVIVNRSTPPHRDQGGRTSWFDTCATFGNYTSGWFEMPDFRIRCFYVPGCVVMLLSKMITHQVDAVHGDRAAFLLFSKNAVHHGLVLPPDNWSKLSLISIRKFCSKTSTVPCDCFPCQFSANSTTTTTT
ncbi:hypothetical protein BDN72DRAFT_780976, partial [Pluteus cervinus]